MKKRLFRVLNFFAFNLLFFALYLNFIHKDSNAITNAPGKANSAAMQGTTLVTNPQQYLNREIKSGIQLGNPIAQKLSYN